MSGRATCRPVVNPSFMDQVDGIKTAARRLFQKCWKEIANLAACHTMCSMIICILGGNSALGCNRPDRKTSQGKWLILQKNWKTQCSSLKGTIQLYEEGFFPSLFHLTLFFKVMTSTHTTYVQNSLKHPLTCLPCLRAPLKTELYILMGFFLFFF